jgi:hypothetical protein
VVRSCLVPTLGLLLAAACAPDPITVPVLTDARAAVLVIESPAAIRAFAHDLVATPDALMVPLPDEATRLTLLLHTRSLAELDLDPGELRLVTTGERVRPLPVGEALHVAEAPELERWTPATRPSSPVADLRVPRSSREACFAREGCFDDTGLCVPCGPPPIIAPPDFEDTPTPPLLTPCPRGWSERRVATGTTGVVRAYTACDASAWTCADGLARLDTGQCAPLGTACPAPPARWGAVPQGARYVDATAAGPGDGRAGSPWTTLESALAAAGPAPTLALAPGEYTLGRDLPAGTTLLGACTGGTTVRGHMRAAGGASLQDLRIEGDIVVSGALELQAVELRGSLRGEDASLSALSSVVTGSVAAVRSTLALHHARVTGVIELSPATTATISDSVLPSGLVSTDATLWASRVLLGPTTLTRSTLSLTAAQLTGPLLLGGGRAELSKVWSQSWLEVITQADVQLTDVLMSEDLEHVRVALDAAELRLTRVAMAPARVQGIDMTGTSEAASLTLADVTISMRADQHGGGYGGIHSSIGRVVGRRLLIEGAIGPAVQLIGDEASVELTDVRVRGCGDGFRIHADRNFSLARATIRETRGQGIDVGQNTGYPNVMLRDVDIDGVVRPSCMDSNCQISGLSFRGRELDAARVRIAGSVGTGLLIGVLAAGSNLLLEQVLIEDNAVGIEYAIDEDQLDEVLPMVRLRDNTQELLAR